MAVTNINGYTIDLDSMKSSTCGMIGIAQKAGAKYFCKKFNNPVEPGDNGALSSKAIAKNKVEFERFRDRKLRMNRTLREIAGIGGNIVFPIEETVYDHHWTEFTEFIENTLPDDQYASIIAGLDDKEKLLVLKVAVGALQTIHNQRIVHGDLKLTNIMLVKNSCGHYVSKIIDFDGAFFEDDVPLDSITGTVDYYSPELAIYSSYDDPEIRAKLSKMITTKSDIFTMGLILHEYLTGTKPEADHLTTSLQKMKTAGKFIYPWQILLSKDEGGSKPQLVIDNCQITEPAYIALISDMLNLEPERRPTAAEVMTRLNSKELPIELDSWPEDHIAILKDKAKEKVVGLRKIELTSKDKPPVHAYEIVERDGRRYNKSATELIGLGLAQVEETLYDPRPEDHIEWNLDAIKKHYVSINPGAADETYQLCDKHGKVRVMSVATLKLMKFAQEIPTHPSKLVAKPVPRPKPAAKPAPPEPALEAAPELWPEDAETLEMSFSEIEKFQIQFLGKAEMNGVRGYKIKMSNDDIQFWPLQKCKMMKILKAK